MNCLLILFLSLATSSYAFWALNPNNPRYHCIIREGCEQVHNDCTSCLDRKAGNIHFSTPQDYKLSFYSATLPSPHTRSGWAVDCLEELKDKPYYQTAIKKIGECEAKIPLKPCDNPSECW